MFITDLAIKRPVFSIALSLMIIIVGLMSYKNLSLQQYPEVEEPVINVETAYYGAAASVIESRVTTRLEDGLSGVTGLDYMESSSKTGRSVITLYFKSGTVLSDAASDVRERIAQVRDQLPDDCKDPKVIKATSSKDPFMFIILTGKSLDELQLYDYAERNLKNPFESLPGVGSVDVYGNKMTMQILLDRNKMKAYGLAVTDVLDLLEGGSQELPAGNIVKGKRHVNIVTKASLNTPEEMGELVVSNDESFIVHLKDIATINISRDTNEDEWIPRFNQQSAVFLGIKKKAGGNLLEISNGVENYLKEVRSSLPKGMHLEIGYNFAMFIDASIDAVISTIFEAIVLVLLIIFLFLHSPRAAVIPLLTIPVSLIGSFAFLYAFNCSINTITLLAMVLAIGLVVDDAIVVLENIHRHIENGLKPFDAAIKGSREVGFAIIAMTLTLASVYAPIAFVQGLTGKLFSEFAVSLAGAVLISGLVALTLSPMMCAKLLKSKKKEHSNKYVKAIEDFLTQVEVRYQSSLKKALCYPKYLLGALIFVPMSASLLFYKIPSELAPQEDQSIIFAWVQGPEGASLEYMHPYALKLEELLTSVPEHTGVWSATQRSGIFGGLTLRPWSKRSRSQSEIIDELRKKARKIPGVEYSIFPMKTILSGGQSGLQMAIKSSGSYVDLEKNMDKLVKNLKGSACLEEVNHDLYLSTPQLEVEIDRNKAALLGVKIRDIARTLEVMLSGSRSTTFEQDSKHYDIVLQTKQEHKTGLENIGDYHVPAERLNEEAEEDKHDLVPLKNLVTVKEVATPADLKHLNKMRSVTLNADIAPNCSMGEAMNIVNAAITKDLPASYQHEAVGNLRKFLSSQGDMYIIFIAALIFIYLVLSIQFESFLDPLLIMVTVPLSIAGALLALYITGGTMNIFSQVGLVTLIGLITKHGILIVEFANKQRAQGLDIYEAIYKATSMRLRPILMTTGAMVLGAVPLALASGAGAESRQQIGWVLVGGLIGGTCFTLYAVPFVYVHIKTLLNRHNSRGIK